jgi:hypothetical protein
MTQEAAAGGAERCGQPVKIAAAFTPVVTDTGHTCQRVAGHEGIHRWSAKWENVSPAEVEAELAREYEKWDKPDDE